MALLRRIANLFRRSRLEREIDAELKSHIEMRIEDNLAAGMTPEAARRDALVRFGNTAVVKERSACADVALGLDSLQRDIQYALRQMRKSPGFAGVVVATLALGIGANTTVFSIVDAVLLRPLPYAHPERLAELEMMSSRHQYEPSDVSYPDFLDWRTNTRSFEHLVSYHDSTVTLTGVQRAQRLDGEVVSWDLLPLLGVEPQLGRGFVQEEEKSGTRVVLISHSLWVSVFAGKRSVLGQNIRLDGEPYTVIGVMPAFFRFPIAEPQNNYWTTLAVDSRPSDLGAPASSRGMRFLNVIGRLRPGVTMAQASQEVHTLVEQLAKQYPATNSHNPSARAEAELTAVLGPTGTLLKVVLGAVVLVLLIACGNVANLLLARVSAREREMAMRAALGAGRGTMARQLLVESGVLGLCGGISGCGLAFLAVPALLRLIGNNVPRATDAGVNLPVLVFALATSLACALLFGAVPAWSGTKLDPAKVLKQSGQASTAARDWLRSTVIVAQIALGVVLTAGAGLLATSYTKMAHADAGFNPDHLLTFLFNMTGKRYENRIPQFYQEYFQRLRALPGVKSAGGARVLPMAKEELFIGFNNPEHPLPAARRPHAEMTPVSIEYFRTMEIPVLRGRDFTLQDNTDSEQVMIVNKAFADKFFPGENPLGKRLRPGAGNGSPAGPPLRTIVGVVGDTRHSTMQQEMVPAMYFPTYQLPNWCCLYSVVRTSVDPLSLGSAVRNLVASMDPELPVTDMCTMQDLIGLQLGLPRFAMSLLLSFAALALLLTLVGLYGVMSYSVMQRTREIGIRLALGAQRFRVFQAVLRNAAVLLIAGIAIGIAATLTSTTVLRSVLFATGPRDPLVLAGVCALVAVVGLLAAYFPAARASAIEPMQALRAE